MVMGTTPEARGYGTQREKEMKPVSERFVESIRVMKGKQSEVTDG